MDNGWIKIHRKILDWEWYDDINVTRLFFHLLLVANHENKKWHGIEIKRGQHITSYTNLALETHLSGMQVRTALNKLKLTGEITHKSTNEYSVITINNYDTYQGNNTQDNKRITNEQQTDNKRITTNKNDKNEKNVNNNTLIEIIKTDRESVTTEVLQEIANKYDVPTSFVEDCWDTAQNWLDAKGKKQKNYKAFLANWVKRARADWILKSKTYATRNKVADYTNL